MRVCLVYWDCKDDFLSNAVIYVAQEVVAGRRRQQDRAPVPSAVAMLEIGNVCVMPQYVIWVYESLSWTVILSPRLIMRLVRDILARRTW